MSEVPEPEKRDQIRQIRLRPSEWAAVQEKAKIYRIPASRLMALAVVRALGGGTELDGDLEAFRALARRLDPEET